MTIIIRVYESEEKNIERFSALLYVIILPALFFLFKKNNFENS